MPAISANLLFLQLPKQVQTALLPHLTISEVARGEIVIDDRQPVTRIGFPLTCVLRIDAPIGQDRYAHTGILGRHHVAGTHVVHLQPYPPRRVTAFIPGYIAFCAVSLYREQFRRSSELRGTMSWLQLQAHRRICQLSACNATHDLRERLARLLLQIHYVQDITELPVSQADLAHILGVRREAISRELAHVQADGLIALSRNRIEILSLERLSTRSCTCHAELTFSGRYDYSTLHPRRAAPKSAIN